MPTVRIITNSTCNYHCTYCEEFIPDKSGVMTMATAKEAVAVVNNFIATTEEPTFINFMGGEIFLNIDVLEYLIASLNAPRFSLLTNGSKPDALRRLLPYKDKCNISVSIDGPNDVHRLNRRNDINHEFLELARQFRDFKVSMTVAPNTVDRMHESYQYCSSLGVSKLQINVARNYDWTDAQLETYAEQFEKVVLDEINIKAYLPQSQRFKLHEGYLRNTLKSQHGCNLKFGINHDGSLIRCSEHQKAFNTQYTSIEECECGTNKVDDLCSECPYQTYCNLCDVSTYFRDKDPNLKKHICSINKISHSILVKHWEDLLWSKFAVTKDFAILKNLGGNDDTACV